MDADKHEPKLPTTQFQLAGMATIGAILAIGNFVLDSISPVNSVAYPWVDLLGVLVFGGSALLWWVQYFRAYIDFRIACAIRAAQESQNPEQNLS